MLCWSLKIRRRKTWKIVTTCGARHALVGQSDRILMIEFSLLLNNYTPYKSSYRCLIIYKKVSTILHSQLNYHVETDTPFKKYHNNFNQKSIKILIWYFQGIVTFILHWALLLQSFKPYFFRTNLFQLWQHISNFIISRVDADMHILCQLQAFNSIVIQEVAASLEEEVFSCKHTFFCCIKILMKSSNDIQQFGDINGKFKINWQALPPFLFFIRVTKSIVISI